MKYLSLALLFFIFAIQNITAQSEKIVGTYQLDLNGTNADLKRTLILNADGTFLFHNYENHEAGIPKEKNIYGKGTWTSEKKVIYFSVEKSDIDEKHTLNFNNSKARFDSKSPRDKSDRFVKTSLRFYESEIFWLKGNVLIKVE